MKKLATNARWSGLPPESVQKLENWLFDEKLAFSDALERAQRELAFTGSLSSLKRFYQRRSRERVVGEFADLCRGAQNVVDAPGNVRLLRTAAMKIVSQLFFKKITENPDSTREWEFLAKLLLQSEDNELRRLAKDEENAIRRENLAFAREKYDFNIVDEMLELLPDVNALHKLRNDPGTTDYDHNRLKNRMKKRMFDDAAVDFLPESEKEEREQNEKIQMRELALKKAREHTRRTGEWIDPEVFEQQERHRLSEIRYPLPECPHTNTFEI
jgi:hypothetical protein